MKRVLRWIGIGLTAVIAGVLLVAIFARMSDGPLGPFPGGPMQGGLVADPVDDWSFVAGAEDVELATASGRRFRTVVAEPLVHNGDLYLHASTIFDLLTGILS